MSTTNKSHGSTPNPKQVAQRRATRQFGEKLAVDALNLRTIREERQVVRTFESPGYKEAGGPNVR
jgi:hypothetical protein